MMPLFRNVQKWKETKIIICIKSRTDLLVLYMLLHLKISKAISFFAKCHLDLRCAGRRSRRDVPTNAAIRMAWGGFLNKPWPDSELSYYISIFRTNITRKDLTYYCMIEMVKCVQKNSEAIFWWTSSLKCTIIVLIYWVGRRWKTTLWF